MQFSKSAADRGRRFAGRMTQRLRESRPADQVRMLAQLHPAKYAALAVALCGLSFVLGVLASQQWSARAERSARLAELLLLGENLSKQSCAQTREYLKERLYVIAAELPPHVLPPNFRSFDYGPVDPRVLRGLRATTSSELESRAYGIAKARHNPVPAVAPEAITRSSGSDHCDP
jgi:hypothetical protein